MKLASTNETIVSEIMSKVIHNVIQNSGTQHMTTSPRIPIHGA